MMLSRRNDPVTALQRLDCTDKTVVGFDAPIKRFAGLVEAPFDLHGLRRAPSGVADHTHNWHDGGWIAIAVDHAELGCFDWMSATGMKCERSCPSGSCDGLFRANEMFPVRGIPPMALVGHDMEVLHVRRRAIRVRQLHFDASEMAQSLPEKTAEQRVVETGCRIGRQPLALHGIVRRALAVTVRETPDVNGLPFHGTRRGIEHDDDILHLRGIGNQRSGEVPLSGKLQRIQRGNRLTGGARRALKRKSAGRISGGRQRCTDDRDFGAGYRLPEFVEHPSAVIHVCGRRNTRSHQRCRRQHQSWKPTVPALHPSFSPYP